MQQIQALVKRIDRLQQRYRLSAFIYAVIKKYGEDDAGYQAALLTYYGFLSLFPLLMIATTLVDYAAHNNPHLETTLINGITDYFPLLGKQLSASVHALHRSGLALAVGILFTLYGARGVADVFRRAVRHIWGYKPEEGFPQSPLKSLAMIIVGGVGLLAASILSVIVAGGGHDLVLNLLSLLVNLFILFWLFVFLLNISLPKHIGLKDIRLGAVCAAVGLVILQTVGAHLLRHQLKNLSALYSYFAVALGLLFWIYLQSQMILYSVQIAVVSSKKRWPRSLSD